MTKINGSIFTILPWFGYSAFGAFISTVFFRHAHRTRFKVLTVVTFFVAGWWLVYYSSWFLFKMQRLTGVELFGMSADFNYLFTRLGNVLIIFGIFYTFERFLKQSIVGKIGQKTLSIYVIHFIILFGSFTGYGLKRFFNKALNPTEAVIGALLFIIVVCFISFHYARTNHFVYQLVGRVIKKIKS